MKTYNAQERKSAATVVVGGKAKFPVKDKRHAELALGEINSAKPPLSSSQKAAVRRKAARYGATPNEKEPHNGKIQS